MDCETRNLWKVVARLVERKQLYFKHKLQEAIGHKEDGCRRCCWATNYSVQLALEVFYASYQRVGKVS